MNARMGRRHGCAAKEQPDQYCNSFPIGTACSANGVAVFPTAGCRGGYVARCEASMGYNVYFYDSVPTTTGPVARRLGSP